MTISDSPQISFPLLEERVRVTVISAAHAQFWDVYYYHVINHFSPFAHLHFQMTKHVAAEKQISMKLGCTNTLSAPDIPGTNIIQYLRCM